MENEILDLIDRYWKFDNDQTPVSNWHDKQDLLEAVNKALSIADVGGSAYRYPMTYDQPCQIDCRVTSCKFYKGAGKCENVSPAITLNENGKFVCWSKADR
jgi:hypothetical protein